MKKFFEYCIRNCHEEKLTDGTTIYSDPSYKGKSKEKTKEERLSNGSVFYSVPLNHKMVSCYAPLKPEQILNLENRIREISLRSKRKSINFPDWYIKFLATMNGCSVLNAISLGGLQTIDRTNPEHNSPFDLEYEHNAIRPRCIPNNYLGIGSYTVNHSNIYADESGRIFVFDGDAIAKKTRIKDILEAAPKILKSWNSLDDFLYEETKRLHELFLKKPWGMLDLPRTTLP